MSQDTFLCPSCKSALRRSAQLTPGTAVKCPRCAHVFEVPAEEEIPFAPLLPEAVSDRPLSPPPAAPPRRTRGPDRDFDFDDDRPRGRRDRKSRRRADVNLTSRWHSQIGTWFNMATREWGDFLGPYIGYAFLTALIGAFGYFITLVVTFATLGIGGIVAVPLFVFIMSAFWLGPLAVAIRAVQGKPWGFNDLFCGFEFFGQIVVWTLLHWLLIFLAYLPMIGSYIIVFAGGLHRDPSPAPALAVLIPGYLMSIVLLLFVQVRLCFSLCLVFEQQMNVVEAMQTSWRMTEGHFWPLLGFQLLQGLLFIGGYLCCGIGLLFTMPLVLLFQAAAYVHITDQPTDGRRDRHDGDGDDDDDDDRPPPRPRYREDERSPRYRPRPDEDY